MTTSDRLAWVAGFWDGEGCVSTLTNYATPQFHLSQAGPQGQQLCQQVLDWSGVPGRIHGPYVTKNQPTHQPYYRVRITGQRVRELAEKCWPWLSETKRAQYQRAIDRFESYRVEHNVNSHRRRTTCRKGHEYSGDNLAITPQGHRRCRRCHADGERARKRRQSASLLCSARTP